MNIATLKGAGIGELIGISGGLTITIDPSGKHSYLFEYEIP